MDGFTVHGGASRPFHPELMPPTQPASSIIRPSNNISTSLVFPSSGPNFLFTSPSTNAQVSAHSLCISGADCFPVQMHQASSVFTSLGQLTTPPVEAHSINLTSLPPVPDPTSTAAPISSQTNQMHTDSDLLWSNVYSTTVIQSHESLKPILVDNVQNPAYMIPSLPTVPSLYSSTIPSLTWTGELQAQLQLASPSPEPSGWIASHGIGAQNPTYPWFQSPNPSSALFATPQSVQGSVFESPLVHHSPLFQPAEIVGEETMFEDPTLYQSMVLESDNSVVEAFQKVLLTDQPYYSIQQHPQPQQPLGDFSNPSMQILERTSEGQAVVPANVDSLGGFDIMVAVNLSGQSNSEGVVSHLSIEKQKHFGKVCQIDGCFKVFSTPSNLKRHVKSFHEKKIAQCNYGGCGKLYTQTSALNRHVRNVHEQIEYKCEYCGYGYTRSLSLNKHRCRGHLPT